MWILAHRSLSAPKSPTNSNRWLHAFDYCFFTIANRFEDKRASAIFGRSLDGHSSARENKSTGDYRSRRRRRRCKRWRWRRWHREDQKSNYKVAVYVCASCTNAGLLSWLEEKTEKNKKRTKQKKLYNRNKQLKWKWLLNLNTHLIFELPDK